jgi:hypothetical protein
MGAGLASPVVSIRMWSNWWRLAHRLLSALTRSSRTWGWGGVQAAGNGAARQATGAGPLGACSRARWQLVAAHAWGQGPRGPASQQQQQAQRPL